MVRLFITFTLIGCLASCQSDQEDEETATGTVMEIEPSQSELDQLALEGQPEIIKDFFAVNSILFGTRFCYEAEAVRQLILYGNDSTHSWSKFEASDHYLTLYQEECEVLLEFMTFSKGGQKHAFLSQMSRNDQSFDCMAWNAERKAWKKVTTFPRPAFSDYFADLTEEEIALTLDYGADFAYLNPEDSCATFIFSGRGMAMNPGKKERIQFNKDAQFEFKLSVADNMFDLEQIAVGIQQESAD